MLIQIVIHFIKKNILKIFFFLETVGVLLKGLNILPYLPPVINSIQPGVITSESTPVTILGSGFNTDPSLSNITLECSSSGIITYYGANNVTSATPTVLNATLMIGTSIPVGAICVVILTSLKDGSYYKYSAISMNNPAGKLAAFTLSASTMNEARRGLGLVPGRVTNAARFLYAIGGDNSTNSTILGVKKSVEYVSLNEYGSLGNWNFQRNYLPYPISFGVTTIIGRYIYLIGGYNGTSATNNVLRAQLLNPLETPTITLFLNIITVNYTSNFTAGIWFYQVNFFILFYFLIKIVNFRYQQFSLQTILIILMVNLYLDKF